MTITLAASAVWVFAYVNTVMGTTQPILGGYGPQFSTKAQCEAALRERREADTFVCIRIP